MKRLLLPTRLAGLLLVGSTLATLAFAPSLVAQERDLSRASPEEVGLSADGVNDLADAMRKEVDEGNLAGVVSALMRNGKLVHLDAYGYQSIADQEPVTEDTIFRIFSMTKPVTSVAMMMLLEEGKFSLDDPVSQYIPELANLEVAIEDGPGGFPVTEPANHEMTIRELMSHTGGLTYGLFSRSQVDSQYVAANILDTEGTLQDMIDKLSRIPLRQQPGTLWHYSVSVDVQGRLVEVLSGMPFDEFLQERIFEPLGMTDTGFYVPEDKRDRFATMYMSGQNGLTAPNDGFGGDYAAPVSFHSGGGGLASTITDYMRFTQMLANGGEFNGERLLEETSVEAMRSNQLPAGMDEIPGYPGNQFGLNFALVTDPARNDGVSEGSYWWWGIGGTWFWIDPVQDLVFIGMIQNRNLGYARQLQGISKRMVYDAIAE
ncbi:serine hydrolase domain-containing protein [Pseudohongiella acticola]|jgi:CubicO group peptidase (beta-lactamase class C family)|uniref:serine hydrolase domain-containing protein n=1 Tax=Pseudohongiella acticola TaxID=1524254 RepID=UPI0030ECC4C8